MDNNHNDKGKTMDMTSTVTERRNHPDRRKKIFRTMLGSLIECRRRDPQRIADQEHPYYTDYYESWLFGLTIAIVLLSVTDAMLTLRILAHGGVELNPVMDAILERGPIAFFVTKYSLTCIGLIMCVLHIRHHVLRLIPMRTVMLSLFGGYLILVAYEISILIRI
ncbi:MAG: DUF5658 family protein [Gammaproteobacteria bacterium]|nr:DUF5658 family protein [Gammaproteobacteria bacterium]